MNAGGKAETFSKLEAGEVMLGYGFTVAKPDNNFEFVKEYKSRTGEG